MVLKRAEDEITAAGLVNRRRLALIQKATQHIRTRNAALIYVTSSPAIGSAGRCNHNDAGPLNMNFTFMDVTRIIGFASVIRVLIIDSHAILMWA